MLVRISTVGVTRLAGGRRAARVTGGDRETRGDEGRVGIEVDGGKIPVKGLTLLGVLELENAVLISGGGHLDGDTAAVRVDLPVLAVGAATGAEGLHVTGAGRSAPDVDIGVQVVDDLDTARARRSGAIIAGHVVGTGQGGSSDSKNAGDKNVGEVHLEKDWYGKSSNERSESLQKKEEVIVCDRRAVCSKEEQENVRVKRHKKHKE